MKFPTILSALALATVATALIDDPTRVDTCTQPGTVALTFDDGPGKFNDQLLALLARKNVKATFFVLGMMIDEDPAQAASLKKMLDAGHQLASHTYTHSNLDKMTDPAQQRLEITRTADTMFKHAGVRPAYMRAPEGNCNEACVKVMNDMGLVVSHWNLDTHDWQYTALPPAEAVTKSMVDINRDLVANSNPATDSWILLEHEIHQFSVELLAEKVIDAVLAKGYKFVTMEQCVGKPAYLPGSTVPSGVPGPLPSGNSTSGVVAPTGSPSAPVASGSPVPSGTAGAPAGASGTPINKNQNNAAGFVKAGAWAMGLVAAVGYALI
ncbi:hypothetical protein BGZ75_010018 [Mortierella antarctica]|nr:hypothetical protein BGZ75_010018 [Mortierella antarctica]